MRSVIYGVPESGRWLLREAYARGIYYSIRNRDTRTIGTSALG